MNWKSKIHGVATLLRQFRLPSAVRLIVIDGLRKLLDPHAIMTYSVTGEDRVIDYYVGYPERGFYVDVGCHYPAEKSSTMRLYRRGWRGLCIDANPDCIRGFRKVRPRDMAVVAAVSDQVGESVFTEFETSQISSLSAEFVAGQDAALILSTRRVQTVTLTELCLRNRVPARFDLLSIDCEGHDGEVLRSLDLDAFRPRVIAIEMHDYDLENPQGNPIRTYLVERGYRLRAYATVNGYYVDARGRGAVSSCT